MAEIIQAQDNRRVFIDTLMELAEKNKNIILVTCDVGFNYLEKFQQKYPKQFLNLGVTEQSAIMICVGLALSGKKPWFYSMINFVLFRPYEMVRNGIVHHNANVKLIGVKGSTGYKFLGWSHNLSHEFEDIEACLNLNLPYHIPKSNEEVRNIILETYENQRAAYIRL